jgi:hypothetical protein
MEKRPRQKLFESGAGNSAEVLPRMLPVPEPAGLFSFRAAWLLSYGKGTLITVFTMVTDALSANALPLSVVIVALPAVENVTPA